jgi:hypothetical protein
VGVLRRLGRGRSGSDPGTGDVPREHRVRRRRDELSRVAGLFLGRALPGLLPTSSPLARAASSTPKTAVPGTSAPRSPFRAMGSTPRSWVATTRARRRARSSPTATARSPTRACSGSMRPSTARVPCSSLRASRTSGSSSACPTLPSAPTATPIAATGTRSPRASTVCSRTSTAPASASARAAIRAPALRSAPTEERGRARGRR